MVYMNRKYPRLKEYDYTLAGRYYVTIHNDHDAPFLSQIQSGDVHHRASVKLTESGIIAIEQLMLLETRYSYVKIDKYVIMPTHIHIIIQLCVGQMPRHGLTDIVGAYKSLVTRAINTARNTPEKKQFQRSFYETVIRNESAYQSCWRYIDENPDKWGLQKDVEWDYRTAGEHICK